MTISLLLTDITGAIAALSISGVTIVDYDGIAANWQSKPNVLYLNPENGVTFNPPVYPSILRGSNAPSDVTYNLNYRFLASQLGNAGTIVGWSEMIEKVIAIYNVLAGTDTPYSGKVYLELGRITVGARSDPAGNIYHGADFELRVTELQN